jgi:hypothetical protein
MVKKGFWKKKDGTIIKIADMDDMHLINVIEMYKKEAIDQYADPNQDEMMWVDGSLSVKFFELQFEAYRRDILPEGELIIDTSTPEEYVPEGMNIGVH